MAFSPWSFLFFQRLTALLQMKQPFLEKEAAAKPVSPPSFPMTRDENWNGIDMVCTAHCAASSQQQNETNSRARAEAPMLLAIRTTAGVLHFPADDDYGR